jgi:hypothetical protein
MNASFALYALFLSGLSSQYGSEQIAPSPDTVQNTSLTTTAATAAQRPANSRPVRASSQGYRGRPRMPLSPTDPRTYGDADMPLPPTMDGSGVVQRGGFAQGGGVADIRPRFIPGTSGENVGRRSANEKPFNHFGSAQNASPYFLTYGNAAYPANGNTSSGTSTTSMSSPASSSGSPVARPFDSYTPPPATSPYMLINSNTNNGTISTYNAYVIPALAQQQGIQNQNLNQAGPVAPSYPPVFLSQGQFVPSAPPGH